VEASRGRTPLFWFRAYETDLCGDQENGCTRGKNRLYEEAPKLQGGLLVGDSVMFPD